MKNAVLLIAGLGLASACKTTAAAPELQDSWSMKARLVESCCCNAICPCMVGSPPTLGHCEGNRLVQIDEGHHGDVNLDGVDLVVTFRIGNWTKLYFSDQASEAQVEAAVELLGKQSGFLYGDLLEVKRVPLQVERSAERIAYSTPETETEIEVMLGTDDEPVQVTNLRFSEYTQFESVKVRHTAPDESQSFEYSGTNGFTANYAKSSS